MIIFLLVVGYILELILELRIKLQVQCVYDQEVVGKVECGGDGVIGVEVVMIVVYQLYGIVQQQQGCVGEIGQCGVGGVDKLQFIGQLDYYQCYFDKGQYWYFYFFQLILDYCYQQGVEYQQYQWQWLEE